MGKGPLMWRKVSHTPPPGKFRPPRRLFFFGYSVNRIRENNSFNVKSILKIILLVYLWCEVMSKFVVQSKFVLLTFPSSDVNKEDALEKVKSLVGLEWAIVCAEKHQDGTPHLHCLVAHVVRFRTRDVNFFDFIAGKHCNIKSVTRTLAKVIEYVIKDGDYICHGIDPVEFLRLKKLKKNTRFALIAKLISEGATMESLNEDYKDLLVMHLRKVKFYLEWRKNALREEQLAKERIAWTVPEGITNSDVLTAEWLEDNVRKPRFLGQKNLWLYGPTGVGKTRLKEQLMKRLRVYVLPYDGSWFDDYEDGKYDIMVLDEFKAQYKIQQMNRLSGSEWTTLNRRGRAPVLCKDRLPVLVLSNYDVGGCYSKTMFDNPGLIALARRFDQVHVANRIDVEWREDSSVTELVEESPGRKRERSEELVLEAKRVRR